MLQIDTPTTFLTEAARAASVAYGMKPNAGLHRSGFVLAFARRPAS